MKCSVVGLAAVAVLLGVAQADAELVFDLAADWSDTNNPNGAWSYNEGNNPLPGVALWGEGITEAWAPNLASLPTRPYLPAWYKSEGTETFTNDIEAGDVVVHSTDPHAGSGKGLANVTWTSQIDAVVDITGAVWMGRDIGRANDWRLYLNGGLLTGGGIWSGDPYSRALPFTFASGSGGPSVLQDVSVSVNDVVRLEFERNHIDGDFVGMTMTIAEVPEPSALAMLGGLLGTGLIGGLSRRGRKAAR